MDTESKQVEANTDLKYYDKCKYYYRIAFCAAIFIVIETQIAKVIKFNSILESVVIVSAFLAFGISTVRGLASVTKSFQRKEPLRKWRILYLAGYLLFLLLIFHVIIYAYILISNAPSLPG